jgi:hypothetical protein
VGLAYQPLKWRRRTDSGAGSLLGWAGFPVWASWFARGPFSIFLYFSFSFLSHLIQKSF